MFESRMSLSSYTKSTGESGLDFLDKRLRISHSTLIKIMMAKLVSKIFRALSSRVSKIAVLIFMRESEQFNCSNNNDLFYSNLLYLLFHV